MVDLQRHMTADKTGSAKAMEPDMVVDMIESSKAKSVTVGTIIGDEDSTTIESTRG